MNYEITWKVNLDNSRFAIVYNQMASKYLQTTMGAVEISDKEDMDYHYFAKTNNKLKFLELLWFLKQTPLIKQHTLIDAKVKKKSFNKFIDLLSWFSNETTTGKWWKTIFGFNLQNRT